MYSFEFSLLRTPSQVLSLDFISWWVLSLSWVPTQVPLLSSPCQVIPLHHFLLRSFLVDLQTLLTCWCSPKLGKSLGEPLFWWQACFLHSKPCNGALPSHNLLKLNNLEKRPDSQKLNHCPVCNEEAMLYFAQRRPHTDWICMPFETLDKNREDLIGHVTIPKGSPN